MVYSPQGWDASGTAYGMWDPLRVNGPPYKNQKKGTFEKIGGSWNVQPNVNNPQKRQESGQTLLVKNKGTVGKIGGGTNSQPNLSNPEKRQSQQKQEI